MAVVLPTYFAVRVLTTPDEPSGLKALFPFALFVGFYAGGFQAARAATELPYRQATLAALAAWAVILPITTLRDGATLAQAVTFVLFVLVTVGLAMLGGLMANRSSRMREP